MSSPVKPQDVQALLPEAEDSICTLLKKLIQISVIWYRYHNYKYDSDGGFTEAFKTEICTACDNVDASTTTT
jgi:hypothetical protein